MTIDVNADWWKTLFDEVYLLTDARSVCDDDLTAHEVDLICDLLPIRREDHILDLCGGHGRHSLELASRGYSGCTVLDYSQFLINLGTETARSRGVQVQFLQGDARDTGKPDASFDHVLILGNSLGYLPEPDDDVRIFKEACRLLKPGGNLLVDVADGEKVRENMSPVAWHEGDGTVVVCRKRELDGNAVSARELVMCKERGLLRDQTYRIRLFDSGDLENLLREADLDEVEVYKDFSARDREGDYGFMNRRIVAVAVKPG